MLNIFWHAAALAALALAQTPVENNPLGTPNLVVNGNFSDGTTGWLVQGSHTIKDNMLCVKVPASGSANVSYIKTTNYFTEVKNDIYFLNFTSYASKEINLWLQTQGVDPSAGGAPVDPNLNTTECPLTTSPHFFTFPYSPANQGNNGTLTIAMGGTNFTTEVCIGNISLHRINRLPYYQNTGAPIKVNQVGYLPDGPKVATYFTSDTSPAQWQLQDGSGNILANGATVPRGNDSSSNLNVHTIDFSSFSQEGSGYILTTGGGVTSYPFTVSSTLYLSLRQDAMQFFYQQRSGIAIDGELVGSQYARPAGHLQIPPNQVRACLTCSTEVILTLPRATSWSRASTNGSHS